MTETNGWPGKPGIPLNPAETGWHWVNGMPREWVVLDDGGSWRFAGSDYRPHEWAHRIYRGPCLTPDEATALQARVAELEARLERLMGPPPDKTKLRVGLIAAGISEKTADEILSSPTFNRAALEGKNDA